MWVYEKKLEYPVRIKTPNPKLAKIIITQYGGRFPNNYVNNLSYFCNSVIWWWVKHVKMGSPPAEGGGMKSYFHAFRPRPVNC